MENESTLRIAENESKRFSYPGPKDTNRGKIIKMVGEGREFLLLDPSLLLAAMRNLGPLKLAIHSQNETEYIDIKSIIRLEADGCYTNIYLEGGRKITVSKALREYEGLLLNENFTRIHNSHVINMYHIRKFVKKDGLMVKMADDCFVPVAVRRRCMFEEKLKSVAI